MIFLSILLFFVTIWILLKWIEFSHLKKVKQYTYSLGIKDNTINMSNTSYQVIYLNVKLGYRLKVNSPFVLEIKKGKDLERIKVDLNKPSLIITYPSKEKMLYTLNENEIDFFDFRKKIYQSYIVPIDHLKDFL